MLSRSFEAENDSVNDVPRYKGNDESLRVGLNNFQTILDSMADFVFVLGLDGCIHYANQRMLECLGYSREELLCELVPRIYPSERHDDVLAALRKLPAGKTDLCHIPLKVKGGEQIPVETRVAHGRWCGQDVLICSSRDISERIEAGQALIEGKSHPSQKMDAIGALAGGIAHDFNNILGVIFGFAQLALREAPEGSYIRDCLEDIFKASDRAKDLVTQILSFSSQREQKQSPTEISKVVKEVAKFLRASLPSTIEINTDIAVPPGSDTVLTDPSKIHQILMNLCTNAAHAMRENGGVLKMSISMVDNSSGTGSHDIDTAPGAYAGLTVSDTGCGIDQAILERIFEPYFTTKKRGEGNGLGLSVVRDIVESHGGAISVESEPGKGTSFHILLPRTEEWIQEESNPVQEIIGGTERILFVDDEQAMVRMWGKLLGPLGYQVVCKTSSVEALDLFRSQSDQFDLVITDQTMPQMTGAELARQLLSIKPEIPIILCTGFSESITAEGVEALGVREYLMKPLVLRSLTQAVRRALDSP